MMRRTPMLGAPSGTASPPALGTPERTAAQRIARRMRLATARSLVADRDQVEPPGRGGRPGLVARASFEQLRELFRRTLEHRADQGPCHVSQERIGRDLELKGLAATVPGAGLDCADEDLVMRLGRRECAEIVLAEQEIGRLRKPFLLERVRVPPGAA